MVFILDDSQFLKPKDLGMCGILYGGSKILLGTNRNFLPYRNLTERPPRYAIILESPIPLERIPIPIWSPHTPKIPIPNADERDGECTDRMRLANRNHYKYLWDASPDGHAPSKEASHTFWTLTLAE